MAYLLGFISNFTSAYLHFGKAAWRAGQAFPNRVQIVPSTNMKGVHSVPNYYPQIDLESQFIFGFSTLSGTCAE
jgi:hypothetical protein